jgi:hypothetical protein
MSRIAIRLRVRSRGRIGSPTDARGSGVGPTRPELESSCAGRSRPSCLAPEIASRQGRSLGSGVFGRRSTWNLTCVKITDVLDVASRLDLRVRSALSVVCTSLGLAQTTPLGAVHPPFGRDAEAGNRREWEIAQRHCRRRPGNLMVADRASTKPFASPQRCAHLSHSLTAQSVLGLMYDTVRVRCVR